MNPAIKERLKDPLVFVLAPICVLFLLGLIASYMLALPEVTTETLPVFDPNDRMLPQPDERGFIAFVDDGVNYVVHIGNLEG